MLRFRYRELLPLLGCRGGVLSLYVMRRIICHDKRTAAKTEFIREMKSKFVALIETYATLDLCSQL